MPEAIKVSSASVREKRRRIFEFFRGPFNQNFPNRFHDKRDRMIFHLNRARRPSMRLVSRRFPTVCVSNEALLSRAFPYFYGLNDTSAESFGCSCFKGSALRGASTDRSKFTSGTKFRLSFVWEGWIDPGARWTRRKSGKEQSGKVSYEARRS